MSRAPFQILVLLYQLLADGSPLYAIFRRNEATGGYWQAIAGGGEGDELPSAAAQREAAEEAGIPARRAVVKLDTMCMIPVTAIQGFIWGPETLVVPEYAFALQVESPELQLSDEHVEYRWVTYDEG